jgi:hypothetical protein
MDGDRVELARPDGPFPRRYHCPVPADAVISGLSNTLSFIMSIAFGRPSLLA